MLSALKSKSFPIERGSSPLERRDQVTGFDFCPWLDLLGGFFLGEISRDACAPHPKTPPPPSRQDRNPWYNP